MSLHDKPERSSRKLIKLPTGNHKVLDHRLVSFGGLRDDSWFQLEVNGREGWIINDTWSIDSKTDECP